MKLFQDLKPKDLLTYDNSYFGNKYTVNPFIIYWKKVFNTIKRYSEENLNGTLIRFFRNKYAKILSEGFGGMET